MELSEEQAFYLSISGEEAIRIFETEIHKKKLLDAAMDALREKNSIYGYCILDEKADFVIGCENESQTSVFARRIMEQYERKLHQNGFDLLRSWKQEIRVCEKEKLWQEIMSLHFLPVIHTYTIWPEHYWWSSYQEYLGRNWMRFQIPAMKKDTREIRREHKEWKKHHPEIFKRIHMW